MTCNVGALHSEEVNTGSGSEGCNGRGDCHVWINVTLVTNLLRTRISIFVSVFLGFDQIAEKHTVQQDVEDIHTYLRLFCSLILNNLNSVLVNCQHQTILNVVVTDSLQQSSISFVN